MNQVILSQGPNVLSLLTQDGQSFINILDSESGKTLASFQIDCSVLASVSDGYSYQIASEAASLYAQLQEGKILFRFSLAGKSTGKWEISAPNFFEKMAIFRTIVV